MAISRELKGPDDDLDPLDREVASIERLAEIGSLACGALHDINNYLTVVLAQCSLLSTSNADNPNVLEGLRTVIDAATAAADLQHSVLRLTREEPVGVSKINVNEVLRRNESILLMAASRRVSMNLVLSPTACIVEFDPVRLADILLNLVNNARDAMPSGGMLEIGLRPNQENDWAVLWIQDTGEGVPEGLLDHICEPFFTTKPVGHGTGLGLTMVRRILEQHGGKLAISSRAGEGTRVELFLPLVGVV